MTGRKVILAGGSGFLGRELGPFLFAHGYQPVILTRRPSAGGTLREVLWDGRTVGAWVDELEGAAAVINLTGKSVNCRYTPEARREIVDSRVDSVRVLDEALLRCAAPPPIWIQAGSLAIYGDAGEAWCPETAPAGRGFPVETCQRWEQALAETRCPARKVVLRISFVLGARGGILAMLAAMTRCFLGGAVGTGRQYVSWIHLADMNRLFLLALEDSAFAGVYNATAPLPVTNAEFMHELRRALHRPWSPPVPVWAARLGAWLLRTEPELALTGRRGTPARAMAAGFDFHFPELRPALHDLFGENL